MQNMTMDEQLAVTRAVLELLDGWRLEVSEMIELLDMPSSVKARNFGRFREQTPFPDEPRVVRRISYLLRISDALRTSYPTNPHMRNRWMQQKNRRFQQQAPLAVMLAGGENGVIRVLAELDCTFAWDMTGSKA
ncbi:MAG: DUF2384 domain-containing protein [gamma proteobacterium symbiont of Bathyaustriella thionipta]|nr:DUF2384 domain-containing protein [gamma proteobacterium symbiont of Bathyaustriella thionipta]